MNYLSDLKFSPYHYAWAEENGARHDTFLICLKFQDQIIKMTTFDKYVKPTNDSEYLYGNTEDDIRRVCNFLTYSLLTHHGRYKADKVTDIPFQAAIDYLKGYSKSKTSSGQYIGRQSVEKERNAICHFMKNLKEKRGDYNEHFYVRKVLLESKSSNAFKRKGRSRTAWEYEIPAVYMGKGNKDLLRDIPQKAIPIILRAVKREEPELFLGVVLELCSGIRTGEVVNTRRANSIYPGGIRYVKENGVFTSFEIDLTKEYILRSDGKYAGSIKIERRQNVYPIFLEIVQAAYEGHLKLINEKYLEPEAPLFVNKSINTKTGKKMAISEQSYCKRIKRIMKEVVLPELLISDELELKVFGMMLNEKNWGLHAFRHWFTVQLVLNEEDLNGIAFWRGDSSLESSFEYLQNKGEIMRLYAKASEVVGNEIMNAIKRESFYEFQGN
ncbi:hypothetical protein FRZ06_11345 [Anoxybacterium hadale]|uniref:Uncharacterized protein n=1 Tax=Anoxybacterium hadale TaxID=3408580 RepID=A0ACD1ACI1_9FIRM|nr:hypothetical protein FRZ06_11345 [Clostridiales bacterium]